MGKYTYEFGGGLKDEEPPSKLTAFAGYVHIDMGNPRDTDIPPGSTTIGGYGLSALPPTPIQRTRFCRPSGQAQNINCLPAGASREPTTVIPRMNTSTARARIARPRPRRLSVTPRPANCAGYLNQGSFLIDYAFNKHWDAYAGISYIENGGGLNSAYLNDNMATFVTGMRLKF